MTTEVALAAAADAAAAADLLAVFEEPPVARPALAWFNASGVWGVLAAKADSPFPRYERMVDQAYGEWLKEREQWQQYGFHNFGDYYGEMGWAWGNNEYDPAFAHLLEFLRGGRPGWAELAAQACRHLIDVDTVNFSREPREVGGQYAHMAGHSGGYLPPYFRYKMKGSTLIPSHMWVEGAVLHYCLTGDENVRETLLRTGEWLLGGGMRESGGGIDAYDFRTCREAGWHLIHLTGMARLADDPRFLNAAFIIVDRVLQRQEPEGGWMRNLKSGHCGCPIPRHRGEASFMVGIMMNGLRRVHQLTGDRRLEDAITGAARWLLAHTWDSAEGLFRYTPCPNLGTHGTSAGNTLQVIEGLGYAYRLTGDAAIGETILAALPHLAQPRLATTPDEVSAIGNRLCSETRSMPSFLADTQELIDHRPATI